MIRKSFNQTSEYGEYNKEIYGSKYNIIEIKNEDDDFSYLYTEDKIGKNILKKVPLLKRLHSMQIIKINFGPIVYKGSYESAFEHTIANLDKYPSFEIIPDIYNEGLDYDKLIAVAKKHNLETIRSATIILDIENKESDKIFQEYDKRLRKNIRNCEGRLIFKTIETPDELKKCYEIYLETSNRNAIAGHISYQNYVSLFNTNRADFFIVLNGEGVHLASQFAVHNDGIVQLSGVAISNYALENEKSANDFLQWNLIKYYIGKKAKFIDWVGYNIDAEPGTKLYNINAFKLKFGGSPLYYYIFKKESKIIKNIRKISKKILK